MTREARGDLAAGVSSGDLAAGLPSGDLAAGLLRRWRGEGWTPPGARLVVGVSGGVDSLVLLHLLRFRLAELRVEPIVAHFDHAMRPGSDRDALWVRGLAGAWDLPVRLGRADGAPQDEAEARTMRYEFLWDAVAKEDASFLLTAHQADDQVETVLFRTLRGTGIRGLAGMSRIRPPGLLRPLLHVSRAEIARYAEEARILPRPDSTNLEVRRARNRLRNEILPRIEAVHPGARAAVLRLARNARRAAEALDALVAPVLEALVREREPGALAISREGYLAHPAPVRNALLRALAREVGIRLDEPGTGIAEEFIKTGPSGGEAHLPGGARVMRRFDLVRFEREPVPEPPGAEEDAPLTVAAPLPAGRGMARVAGRAFRVSWGEGPAPERGAHEMFDADSLAFPLSIRRRRAGDRTRGPGGRRKLKKVLGELRVPKDERDRLPVVGDARGEVLWVPGWFRAAVAPASGGTRTWHLGIQDEREQS